MWIGNGPTTLSTENKSLCTSGPLCSHIEDIRRGMNKKHVRMCTHPDLLGVCFSRAGYKNRLFPGAITLSPVLIPPRLNSLTEHMRYQLHQIRRKAHFFNVWYAAHYPDSRLLSCHLRLWFFSASQIKKRKWPFHMNCHTIRQLSIRKWNPHDIIS